MTSMHEGGPDEERPRSPYANSRIPEHVLDAMLGLGSGMPFVEDGATPPPQGPYVRKRRPPKGSSDTRCYYEIVDRTTEVEARLLGRPRKRHVEGTGCKEGEEAAAANVFAMFLAPRRAALLGSVMPMQVSVLDVLTHFARHLASGAHDLQQGTVSHYWSKLPSVVAYFGHMRVGEVRHTHFGDYVYWRTAQAHSRKHRLAEAGKAPLVSRKTAAQELAAFHRAVTVFEDQTDTKLGLQVHVPSAPRPHVVHLDPDEAARYLWACRGRIWNPEKGRWRVARDDDPSLAGPEGDRRVLRPPEVIGFRRAMARCMLASIYSGGRLGTLLATRYDDPAGAHLDFYTGALIRKGEHEAETNKVRGAVLLPEKLSRWIRNWARHDRAKGITHMIHKPDGTRFARCIKVERWRALDADAGVGIHFTAHVGRHTCAHWLKNEGVSIWMAADFLSCSPEVLQRFYGRWDVHSHAAASAALSSRRRQRVGLRTMKDDGLR